MKMKKKKTKWSTPQALQHQVLRGIAILDFVATITLALALVTYWLGVWGKDILKVEITVGEGLLFLLATLAVAGILLQHYLSPQAQGPVADYSLRIQGGKVFRGMEELQLTQQEFRFLQCLMRKEKGICEYRQILEQVWQEEHEPSVPPDSSDRDRLTALVLRLRKKITPIPHDYIRNHPGRGYEFVQWESGHDSQ
jgi:DNA-binding winged helix-turn-helix (wHTH) protein